VHVQSGLGTTSGTSEYMASGQHGDFVTIPGLVNGKGNLLVGYNEKCDHLGGCLPGLKTGSHNLVSEGKTIPLRVP
jgi:hypothetical protein